MAGKPPNDDIKKLTQAIEGLTNIIGADKRARREAADRVRQINDGMKAGIISEQQGARMLAAVESSLGEAVISQEDLIFSSRTFIGRALSSQFPTGEHALPLLAYSRAAQGGRAARAYGLGELLKMQAVANRPVGAPLYAPGGGRAGYSKGTEGLSGAEAELLYSQQGLQELGKSPTFLDSLGGKQLQAYDNLLKIYEKARGGPLDEKQAGKVSALRQVLDLNALVGRGQDVTGLLESSRPELQSIGRSLSGQGPGLLSKIPGVGSRLGAAGRAGSLLFGAGEALQMGARLAGPIGWAVAGGLTAYEAGKMLYAPNRSGASLGYGYGGPFGEGAQTAFGRSIQTTGAAAFLNYGYGVSGTQLKEARSSLERMGVGGPGQENRYNAYFRSMADVMKNTQLSADTLAPFYENVLRAGGAPEEIEKLTKLLKDELPEAANSSRMSLQQMAESVTKTVDTLASSPFNAATKPQLTQAVIGTAGFGVPQGLQSVGAGGSVLADAMAMSMYGIKTPFALSTHPAEREMAAVQMMIDFLPKSATKNELGFFRYQNTDEGPPNIAMLGRMLNITPDTMNDIISRGPKDVLRGLGMAATLNPVRRGPLEVKRFSDDDINAINKKIQDYVDANGGDPRLLEQAKAQLTPQERFIREQWEAKNLPGEKMPAGVTKYGETSRSQLLIEPSGKEIDLYKVSGKSIERDYKDVIKTIQESLKGDSRRLQEFNERISDRRGGLGIRMYDEIERWAKAISKDATQSGSDTLTIKADDWLINKFKFVFHSEGPHPGTTTIVSPGNVTGKQPGS